MIVRREVGFRELERKRPELLPHFPVRQVATLAAIHDDAPAQVRQCKRGAAVTA